jgi:Zn-dependent protease/CBS domain-containing protein
MRAKGLKIGRIAGIPVHIAPTWLLIVAGMTWILADAYLPGVIQAPSPTYWVLGVATTLLFFATVLLHEMGHALVSRAQGIKVRQVTLLFFGGLAEVDSGPSQARDELFTALIGPALTLGIGVLFGVLHALTRTSYPLIAAPARALQVINIGLGLFNLLPGLPLDGGRILRAALWAITGDPKQATQWAARVGQWLGILIMSAGVLMVVRTELNGGVIAALVGLSLHQSARSAYSKASLEQVLDGRTVADLMQPHSAMLSLNDTLDRLPQEMLMGDTSGYLVGEGGRVVGVVSLRRVRRVPREAWAHTRLDAVVLRRDEIESVSPDTPLGLALQRMTGHNLAQLPVEANGELEGILSRHRIITFVEMQAGARGEL